MRTVRLTRLILDNFLIQIKQIELLTKPLSTASGLRQIDILSLKLFNLALEKAIVDADESTRRTIFIKSIQPGAYADDDFDIVGKERKFGII